MLGNYLVSCLVAELGNEEVKTKTQRGHSSRVTWVYFQKPLSQCLHQTRELESFVVQLVEKLSSKAPNLQPQSRTSTSRRCPLALGRVCWTRRRVERWEQAEMPEGLGMLWEMSRSRVSVHWGAWPAWEPDGKKGRRTFWQETECALREIVCARDVPDVDSHWFANRETQAPGAMSKRERLPFTVTTGKMVPAQRRDKQLVLAIVRNCETWWEKANK